MWTQFLLKWFKSQIIALNLVALILIYSAVTDGGTQSRIFPQFARSCPDLCATSHLSKVHWKEKGEQAEINRAELG